MTKRKHRRHSIPFKRMIVEAYFNGTALNALSVEHDICRLCVGGASGSAKKARSGCSPRPLRRAGRLARWKTTASSAWRWTRR